MHFTSYLPVAGKMCVNKLCFFPTISKTLPGKSRGSGIDNPLVTVFADLVKLVT